MADETASGLSDSALSSCFAGTILTNHWDIRNAQLWLRPERFGGLDELLVRPDRCQQAVIV